MDLLMLDMANDLFWAMTLVETGDKAKMLLYTTGCIYMQWILCNVIEPQIYQMRT